MAPRPCLGYPTTTAAASALLAEGFAREEVARQLGITTARLSSLVDQHGNPRKSRTLDGRGTAAPLPQAAKMRDHVATVTISLATIEALRPHARRRDMSVEALVRAIVDTVALERMVDEVLDDGEDA